MRLLQREQTEADIKRQICQWLEAKRCFFWIQSAGKIPGRINRSRYQRNGVPDILGVWQGRMLGIEVKKRGGRVSGEQQQFLSALNAAGGIGFLAYSLDDVIRELEKE